MYRESFTGARMLDRTSQVLRETSLIGPVDPPNNVLIDLFPMTDGEDCDLCRHHLEDDTVVADAKFPISLESLAKGASELLGSLCKARLDRVCDTST